MGRKKPTAMPTTAPAIPEIPAAGAVVMCLYVAEGAPNSQQAVANLAAICTGLPRHSFALEVIDVLTDPMRALADGILVTPSLNKLAPSPAVRLVGNLSDTGTVLRALGLGT